MANTKTPRKKKTSNEITDDNTTTNKQPAAANSTTPQQNEDEPINDETFVTMPEVSDIPGQEKIIQAGIPDEMGDTTIASDDEEGISEGKDLFDEEEEDDVKIVMGTEADVTNEDLALLGDPDQDLDMNEDELISKEGLDDTDADGDPLNEAAVNEDSTGEDLDIPEEEENDPRKVTKSQDDEENDYYSLGSGDNDELNEGRKDE